MVHDRVDIEKWKEMFPLHQLRDDARDFVLNRAKKDPSSYKTKKEINDHIKLMQPSGEQITSPYHIAVVEQLRAEAFNSKEPSDRVPTDVFVMSKGEPEKRENTKVGGLPYWQKKRNWPELDGNPLTFIAQFCFSDSKDIVGPLPGDILLLFGSNDSIEDMDPFGLHFEWVSRSTDALVSSDDIPRTGIKIPPCFGAIHRTYDYPTASKVFQEYKQSYLLDVIEGTKIGGLPRWIQGEEEMSGEFLCSLGSVHPKKSVPYPFLNQSQPIDLMDFSERGLMWGDVGSVFIFNDKKGRIRCSMQCY